MADPKDRSPSYRQITPIPYDGKSLLTQEEAEAKLHKEGYETFCWYDVPGTTYPNHRHPYDECLWVLRGELSIQIDKITHRVIAGFRIYLPARTSHIASVAKGLEGVTYLVGQKKKAPASG